MHFPEQIHNEKESARNMFSQISSAHYPQLKLIFILETKLIFFHDNIIKITSNVKQRHLNQNKLFRLFKKKKKKIGVLDQLKLPQNLAKQWKDAN